MTAVESIAVVTTGGTIDKVYFDAKSLYEVGEPFLNTMFDQARVTAPVQVIELMRKDSLEVDDTDRQLIYDAVEGLDCSRIIVTHGTDTMAMTARKLASLPGRTIVLTGAFSPGRFSNSDAVFNLGLAFGAVQSLPFGVYIAINGQVFDGTKVTKNRETMSFEPSA